MKRNYAFMFKFALIWVIALNGLVSVLAQKDAKTAILADNYSIEVRPFDFSDKYYTENGIEPSRIIKRRNGADGISVFDYINDPHHRGVRIQGVFPAYNQVGKPVFWNLYGEIHKEDFPANVDGDDALRRAHNFPLYVFPSEKGAAEFRQAHLVNMRDSYFEKNPIGLSVQVLVEFTNLINTIDGQKEMSILADRNGVSLDGTPIIKTALEIEELTQKNYITQKIKSLARPGEPAYAIAKVMQNPARGAITPDAFLLNSFGLPAEERFVRQFDCLKLTGNWCR